MQICNKYHSELLNNIALLINNINLSIFYKIIF